MKSRILVADDERLLRWSVRRKCEAWGYEVVEAETRDHVLFQLKREPPDLLLLDVHLGDHNGVDLLAEIRADHNPVPVIVITADPRIEDVKRALRLGAFDYLSKPVNFDEVEITIANALDASRLRDQVATLRGHARRQLTGLEIIGASAAMGRVMEFVLKVAASPATAILLQGESGTGKDLIAQIIHHQSARRDQPFVPVNCSALPDHLLESELFGHERGAFTDAKALKKGLFETAQGGTIFLDEIGELPLLLQSKLLRTLENQTFRRVGGLRDFPLDVRVIAASNRDLEKAVAGGSFRQDLYYRLGVIPVFIPPLRSRSEDVPALAAFFIDHYNQRFHKQIAGLEPEAESLLRAYAWPGNVRELKNAIQRAMILDDGPLLRSDSLPFSAVSGQFTAASAFPDAAVPPVSTPVSVPNHSVPAVAAAPVPAAAWSLLPDGRALPLLSDIPIGGTSLEEVEKLLLRRALRQSHGNQSNAGRLLNISRDVMRYKMKKFGLRDDPGLAADH